MAASPPELQGSGIQGPELTRDLTDRLMTLALEEAAQAATREEVPVGAVLADTEGTVLAQDGNRIVERHDPTAHAEILVIREAARRLGNERLTNTILAVSLEPCAMCAGAMAMARVGTVLFAASDPKGGAILHGPRFFDQPTCHHRPSVHHLSQYGPKAGDLLRAFFRARRAGR